MSLFSIPGEGAPTALPRELQDRVDQSVAQFEGRWKAAGLLLVARTQGWIEDYRRELTQVALASWKLGKGTP